MHTPVQLELGDAIEDALNFPWDARHAMKLPPHADAVALWLPDALHVQPTSREKQPPENPHSLHRDVTE
jgi:hypothetical protein